MPQRKSGGRTKSTQDVNAADAARRALADWKILQRQRRGRTKGMKVGKCCNGKNCVRLSFNLFYLMFLSLIDTTLEIRFNHNDFIIKPTGAARSTNTYSAKVTAPR